MQHDDREPGAERPDAPGSEAPERGPAAPDGDAGSPDEAPAAAEAWPSQPSQPSQPSGDEAETAEWRTPSRDEPSPPSEAEAYPTARATEMPADPESAPPGAHGVPPAESAVGESTRCPRCGTENRPGLAFCRSCGQRLVAAGVSTTVERPEAPEGSMACPRCGTHNRAGVAFCQNCGANLRGVGAGYVPPAVPAPEAPTAVESGRRGAVLGPVVLVIGLVGLVTAYLLPFAYGSGSLWERAAGPGGYGVAFWSAYPEVGAALTDQVYFGLAAPVLLLGVLLLALAIAGFVRATPGPVQTVGLGIALLWSVGLAVLFVIVELAANWDGDLVGLLRALTPAGIIMFLSSLIVIIGTLTRFGRS